MKAWEIATDLFLNASPRLLTEEEQTWEENISVSDFHDSMLSLMWSSNVPGSGAPEKVFVAGIQAMENRGYRASAEMEQMIAEGIEACERKDMVLLHKITAKLWNEIQHMEKDLESPYWTYRYYDSFEAYASETVFPEAKPVAVDEPFFREQLKASWLSQLIGAAFGTMVEGYTSENLYKTYGEVREYLRQPDTYNDDITYELAFLKAFTQYGYDVTSEQIALEWIGLVPAGWSAEDMALRNIRIGIFPPESGTYLNPYNEWIGAQMRGGICGMAAPGDPYLAAKLAWADGEVSHANNGIFGEVFNAVMTSMAFVESDIRKIVQTAVDLMPKDSEYYSVVKFALDCCREYSDWKDALKACHQKYIKYNWIHAYPNACCEVIALWYGNGNYEETLMIITMCGLDVDCNAAMIMPIVAIPQGMRIIPNRLIHPVFEVLRTYMREYRKFSLEELVDDTLSSIKKALERRNTK